MTRRQKGKSKKRKKSWHRGRGEHRRFMRAQRMFDGLDLRGDPTSPTPPEPVRQAAGGGRTHGESI